MSQYLHAAESIISRLRRPMKARELVDEALSQQIFSDKIHGRTPYKTMQARLSEEIVARGDESTFVRTAPGTFFLRRLLNETADAADPTLAEHQPRDFPTYRAPRRKPPPPREKVLVLPAEVIKRTCRFQGFRALPKQFLEDLRTKRMHAHMDRLEAEGTEKFRQVVTYVLVRRGDEVLSFRRGSYNQAASFLRGSLCIGFGGHVSEDDYSILTHHDFGIRANSIRELHEEIGLAKRTLKESDVRVIGMINDESSAVGRRHIGIVCEYHLKSNQLPQKGEASINQLRWIDLNKEPVDLNAFEYWSQLCWRHVFPNYVRAQPTYKIVRRRPFRSPCLLVILGTIGSGKSVTTRHLADEHGYVEVNSGRVLAELLGIPPVPRTPRDEFQDAAWRFISTVRGPQRLARALFAAAKDTKSDRVVIDGIRQRATLIALRELAAPRSIAVVYVHAAPDVALRFFQKRETKARDAVDSFNRVYGAPVEEEVRNMIADADAVIYNWSGRKSYSHAIDLLMRDLEERRR